MSARPRRERGQTAIGRALNVSQSAVRQWVAGINKPEPEHRKLLEELTGIPASDWELPEEREAREKTLALIRAMN
jgi:transcriptional regulator with XRE-family HTH domain